MREESRKARQKEIEAAAYRLIGENGYDGMSMLAVARAARASNETLYRWYGDKLGLFRAMVDTNADHVRAELVRVAGAGASPIGALKALAPILLAMLTGERAVALNRAAAADPSGELGRALAARGRDTVVPVLAGLIADAMRAGDLEPGPPGQVAERYIALVVGDIQIRRVTGAMPVLSEAEIAARAARGWADFLRLCQEAGGKRFSDVADTAPFT